MAKAILQMTEAAIERAEFLLKKSEEPVLGLRVSLTSKGCSGQSYKIDYVTEDNRCETDDLVEEQGMKIFIDREATLYLLGTVMDYKEDQFHAGFTFDNPNVESTCGCGESVSFRVKSE